MNEITELLPMTDESIPTVSLGVDNTETGHCSKTMAIIQRMGHVLATEKNPPTWFVLADDDTILRSTLVSFSLMINSK